MVTHRFGQARPKGPRGQRVGCVVLGETLAIQASSPRAVLGWAAVADDAPLESWYDPEVVAAIESWEPPVGAGDRPMPSRLVRWSRSTALGAVMSGFGLGLQEVLEPSRDQAIVIEVDADGEPHDLPIQLFLDPDDPAGSLCVIRRDPPPPVV